MPQAGECAADLHAGLHDLAVGVYGPHAHHPLLTPTDDSAAVRGPTDGSHRPLVCIVNGVQQLAALGAKRSDLAIAPPTDNALSVLHHHARTTLHACQCLLRLHCAPVSAVLLHVWRRHCLRLHCLCAAIITGWGVQNVRHR